MFFQLILYFLFPERILQDSTIGFEKTGFTVEEILMPRLQNKKACCDALPYL
jgi:hypothetical protein